jgi:type VI secretion system Hcp family effector
MADRVYMTVKVENTDITKGASAEDSIGTRYQEGDLENKCEILSFEHEIKRAFDQRAGTSEGETRHGCAKVIKHVDKVTSLIRDALFQNKKCDEVVFEWYRTEKGSKLEPYYKITLENAWIVRANILMPNVHKPENANVPHNEEVEFTYSNITYEHLKAKTTATDTWKAV